MKFFGEIFRAKFQEVWGSVATVRNSKLFDDFLSIVTSHKQVARIDKENHLLQVDEQSDSYGHTCLECCYASAASEKCFS